MKSPPAQATSRANHRLSRRVSLRALGEKQGATPALSQARAWAPDFSWGLGKSIMFNDISELRVSRIEMV